MGGGWKPGCIVRLKARVERGRAQRFTSAIAGPSLRELDLTRPNCGFAATETMPIDACSTYECAGCHACRPNRDCCVFVRLAQCNARLFNRRGVAAPIPAQCCTLISCRTGRRKTLLASVWWVRVALLCFAFARARYQLARRRHRSHLLIAAPSGLSRG
jgi:hypothetical protein